MTLLIDPIWPWRLLFVGLTGASASVIAAVISASVVALSLPILLVRYPAPSQRRRFLLGSALVLAGLLAWAAVGHAWKTPLEMPVSGGGVWLARLAGVGLTMLFIVPMALAGLTAATYLGGDKPPGRAAIILALRAAAFLLAAVAILRPSFAFPKDANAAGYVLYVLVDDSESMTIQDEGGKTRWQALQQYLRDAAPALDRLRKEQNVRVESYRFDANTAPFSPESAGEADGKRTDIGAALHWLNDQNNGRRVRGVLLVSDGRNNGDQRIDPFTEARRLGRLGPLFAFGVGSPNTPNGQKDVAVVHVDAVPSVAPTKSKVKISAIINAHGFENSTVRVHLLFDNAEVKSQDAVLRLSKGNQVVLEADAPDKPGEIHVKVKVDAPPGDLNPDDNENGTIVSVVKGGVNVLVIDKERAWEPQLICDALAVNPNIQVKPVWIRSNAALDPNAAKLFDFDKQKYDVIIIGDVTAKQLKAIDPTVLTQIRSQVERGAGFLMIGGYASFGGDLNVQDSGWKGTELEPILPVNLNVGGQVEGSPLYGLKMRPTEDGLRLYGKVLDLVGGEAKAETDAWDALQGLQGANRIAPLLGANAAVLAESDVQDPKTGRPYPLLVERDYGAGRVLAFAGDTTNRWIRDPDSKRKHGRFWRQMILWLARQEGEDQVRVIPDMRSVAVGRDLGFSLGLRSKNGQDIPDGEYEVEVVAPDGKATRVTPTKDGGEDRGVFRPGAAGEYLIRVRGHGKDADGADVGGEATAKFLAFEEDVELAEWAADEDFLKKLADEGRGEYRRAVKLASFLEQMPAPPAAKTKPRVDEAPDWNSASWSPFFLAFFVLFTGLLAAEWFLRRRWGMV